MVICSALKLNEYIVVPCCRHHDGFSLLKELGIDQKNYNIVQGFITDENEFLDRKQAYERAKMCGQIPVQLRYDKVSKGQNELFSEDLY